MLKEIVNALPSSSSSHEFCEVLKLAVPTNRFFVHKSLWLGFGSTQSFRMSKQLLRGTQGEAVTAVPLFLSSFIHKMNTAEFKSATFPNAGPRHLLDDSVMEPHVPSRGQAESSTLSSGISIGKSCKRSRAPPGFGFIWISTSSYNLALLRYWIS